MTDAHLPILTYRDVHDARHVSVDVTALVWSKLLIQAGSGFGKSWAVRQLCEETFGRVPQLIIDPEGEFHTLREKFDYVLAAPKGGDVEASVKTAPILARRLVELSASAVIDIFELKPGEQRKFVRVFLETLIALPRALWHPTLVVLDEIQMFAPEKGHGEAESLDAVGDFGTRARKRGFSLIGATTRLSKLHKDVAGNLNNKLIGYASLDIDIKRAAGELGFDKEHQATINQLDPGQFYAYGPAISKDVQLVRTGPVKTTHPEAGVTVAIAAAPPSSKVRALIASSLADLPKEAEEEARTIDELRLALRKSEREIGALKRGVVQTVDRVVEKQVVDERAIKRAVADAVKPFQAKLRDIERHVPHFHKLIAALGDQYEGLQKAVGAEITTPILTMPVRPPAAASRPHLPAAQRPRGSGNGDTSLPKGERATLIAIAQYPDGAERNQLTVLTGYKRSTRDSYIQRLGEKGFIEVSGGLIIATDAGVAALGNDYEPLPTGDALRDYWLGRLPAGEAKVLQVLLEAGGDPVDRDVIDEQTGFARSSRDSYLQRLSSRRLVESVGRGEVRASATLFDR